VSSKVHKPYKPRITMAERYPDGIPAGLKTPSGWLVDDGGEPDMTAVTLVVSGARCPDLTFREACIATAKLVEEASRKPNISARELIASRFGIPSTRAKSLMAAVRDKNNSRWNLC
jgi:hypothetical protein